MLCRSARGQSELGGSFAAAGGILRKQGINNKPGNSTEPSGFPALPSREGDLPPPRPFGPEERSLQIVSAVPFSSRGNHVHATGPLHAIYKGYDLYGDSLDGDKESEIYTVQGHVKVVGADAVIKGDKVTVDFKNRTFVAERADVDLRPTFFPLGRVLDDIYVKSSDEFGSRRELFGDLTELTTCNLPDPHFKLVAKTSDVRPGRRMILRHVELWILKKHILTIPYLSIPLDDRTNRYSPEVGHTQDEGYYAKLKVPITLHSNTDFLDARVDEYTKLGQALGLDYDYQTRRLNGVINLYSIFGLTHEFDASIHHDQLFGKSDFTLDANLQDNNHLTAPGSTLVNVRSQFTIPGSNGTIDQFSFTRNSNSGGGFSTLQQLIGFNDSRVWSPATHSTLSLNLSDNTSSFGGSNQVESKELDVNFDATTDWKKFLGELKYLRNIPIGQNNNSFFGVSDQTPVFSLTSDASRLLSRKLAPELPFQVALSYGQFGTPGFFGAASEHVGRGEFDFNFTKPDHPEKRFDVSFAGRFQQGIYSDDTAQYANGFDASTRYNLGRDTAWNLHYDFLDQHGFTPLEFDRTGRTNMFSSDLSVRPFRTFLIGAQTGYDYLQIQQGDTPWQNVGIRSEWRPRPWFQLRGLASYDTFQKSWSNMRFDLAYKPGATLVTAGFLYDGIQHRMGDLTVYVDGFKWGRLKTSMILDYDGYIKEFTTRQFSFTYDLHCAEVILQILDNPVGFRPGTQIAFFFRLKAFPFNTPFGIGNRGQAAGTGTGFGY